MGGRQWSRTPRRISTGPPGTTHLVTRRASQASSAQRAGRAARQGPGVAYRLWEEAAHAGRPAFDPPEVETADLAPLLLRTAQWGSADPASLCWLDKPPRRLARGGAERAAVARRHRRRWADHEAGQGARCPSARPASRRDGNIRSRASRGGTGCSARPCSCRSAGLADAAKTWMRGWRAGAATAARERKQAANSRHGGHAEPGEVLAEMYRPESFSPRAAHLSLPNGEMRAARTG